jgi:hypothetical protein
MLKKFFRNHLKPIEVNKVPLLGHFILSFKRNQDLRFVISDKVINVS